MPDISTLMAFLGNGGAQIFGGGIILGIVMIIIFFFLAYKFELPPILMMIIVGTAGYFVAASLMGDWIRALVLIGFGTAIAIIGYQLVSR